MTSMIEEAADAIHNGELVVFPTDTVYGIGCDPFNEKALKLLYEAKKRPPEKSIPVLVDSIATASALGEVPSYCEEILEKFWPGGLTIIVKQKTLFPSLISHNETIALRMPNHEDLRELITHVGGALAATSANISGKPPVSNYDEAYATFANAVRIILPGVAPLGVSSTIIDCTGEAPVLVRQGPVTIE